MQNVIPFNRESFGQLLSKKFLLVIVISIPSAIVADFFKVPLAWMIGPMIATSLIALKGFQVIMPRLALSSILIILGLHIGNYIDQNLLYQMVNWIWTTIIMFLYIVVSILIVSNPASPLLIGFLFLLIQLIKSLIALLSGSILLI